MKREPRDLSASMDSSWRCFLSETHTGSLSDIINWADVRVAGGEIRRSALNTISEGNCKPHRVDIVDYPKSEVTVRPLARLSVEDRLIYGALVLQIADYVDALMNPSVLSYRWRNDSKGLWVFIYSWIRMQRTGRQLLKRDKNLRLAKTDITSFYETVDLGTLMDDIEALDLEGYEPTLLNQFLTGFQEVNNAWGLPQGPDASGILANLYLSPIDGFLKRGSLRYLRYSDDMYVFSRDWDELRSVLIEINRIMRSRRLVMSGAKTDIFEPDEAIFRFEDAEKDLLQYELMTHSPRAPGKLRAMFKRSIDRSRIDKRDFDFSLNRLGWFDDGTAIDWTLENLPRNSHVARSVVRYYFDLNRHTEKIEIGLAKIMKDADTRTNSHLEQQIIWYFLSREIRSPMIHDIAWSILEDRNKESFVREFSARYIGRHSVYGDGQRLKHLYENEESVHIRRALLVALRETGYSSKKILDAAASSRTELRWTARYLLQEPYVPLPVEKVEE